jgi:hypothetical protein
MDWMKELRKEHNNDEFSLLVHNYFKLTTMRIMQNMRDAYDVPEEGIPTLVTAIIARLLNEACYAVGAQISDDYKITDICSKEQLCILIKVLSGEHLDRTDRDDLDMEPGVLLEKFKMFVLEHGRDF